MVVYTSLHLVRDIGIDIRNLGVLFSIMLIPFVIGGMPVEKILSESSRPSRVLAFGFFLLLLGAIAPLYYAGSAFLVWALILFISRIGAVILETGAEALFFKVVSEEDIALISTFRLMHPLSYFCAAIIGSSILHFANIVHIFSFVSILMLCMIFFTLTDKNLTSISLKKT
jgi:predicted MFS family arabinose efflux permease